MLEGKQKQMSQILEHLADSLDIPESRYQTAEDRYRAVGQWLGKEDSPLALYKPDIYPQGSFRLGTVVKPITDKDEYDIDLVCELEISKGAISQKEQKQMVGSRLWENKDYRRMLDKTEGRRCWTLHYADGAQFHMDILPAIPDDEIFRGQLVRSGVEEAWTRQAICITDNTRWDYELYGADWPRSNPRGYSEWFKERMKVQFELLRASFAEQIRVSIEDVPDFKVKTPLQRSIQLLKRHRDMMFEKDPDHKPVSIIITTLAALAYQNQADLYETIATIAENMPSYIQSHGGVSWVPNPVNPMENFADKWQENPKKELTFRNWLREVKEDLKSSLAKRGLFEAAGPLKKSFGEKAVGSAFEQLGDSYQRQRSHGILKMASGTGILGNTGSTPVKEHTFYGR